MVDGTATPLELEVQFDEGNLTYTERKELEYRLNRGDLETGEVREGDDVPLEVSFEGRFNKIRSSTGGLQSISEFLSKTGAGASNVTVGDLCEPYAVDLVLTVTADCGTVEDEIITFGEFRYDEIGGNFGEGTISVQGRCKIVRPSVVRT